MRITDLLDKRSIAFDKNPANKQETLDMAVDLMCASGKINDTEAYRKQVYLREEESTTGIGEGIAIPHGKCDAVVTDMPTGKAACVAYPDFKLLDFTGTDGEFEVSDEDINIGISLKKGNDELKDAINGVLSEMTEDDFNKMMDEAISVQPLSE